jgi:putative transposase
MATAIDSFSTARLRGRGQAPHAPWQNPFVERFVGSARRECFDHVSAFNEASVRKFMTHFGSYYEKARTHLALDKDTPIPRPVMPPGSG